MNFLISALLFIIRTVFELYIIVLLLRFILQKLHASWHNPFSQTLFKLTEKPLTYCRKFIPGYRGFDFSILVFAFILQWIETAILNALLIFAMPNVMGVSLIAVGYLLTKIVYIYIYAILANAVMSWFVQWRDHPLMQIIDLIVTPLLTPVRRLIPLVGGIDISPIPVLLGLTLVNMFIAYVLISTGMRMIFAAG